VQDGLLLFYVGLIKVITLPWRQIFRLCEGVLRNVLGIVFIIHTFVELLFQSKRLVDLGFFPINLVYLSSWVDS
jgi:hypothetical protein